MGVFSTLTLISGFILYGVLPYLAVVAIQRPPVVSHVSRHTHHSRHNEIGSSRANDTPKTQGDQLEHAKKPKGLTFTRRTTDNDRMANAAFGKGQTYRQAKLFHTETYAVDDDVSELAMDNDEFTERGVESSASCRNKTIHKETCCNITHDGYADCSCCKFTEVPKLPDNIIVLNLALNHLNDASLFSNMFANYSNLKVLNLIGNQIEHLPDGIFNGLSQLQNLNLMWNKIAMNQELNESKAFQPLATSLTTLVLHGNNLLNSLSHNLIYPDHALSFLGNLTRLYLDGPPNQAFGSGFAKLKNLRDLTVAGFRPGQCNMSSLDENTFVNLRGLTHLNISDCRLLKAHINSRSLSPLKNLVSLDISNNFGLSLRIIGQLMYGLRNNQNFKHLKMQRVGPRYSPCVFVFKDYLKNFENMTLETLEASDNALEMVDEDALQRLRTLRKLNLRNNKMMFGAYWKDLDRLTNLKEIVMDQDLDESHMFPTSFPWTQSTCKEKPDDVESPRSEGGYESHVSPYLNVSLPPNLETFSMRYSSINYNIAKLNFYSNNSLKAVDLGGNVFKELYGPVTGLHHLEKLDLSECHIHLISRRFFEHFQSLRFLQLSYNVLGDHFYKDFYGATFASSKALVHLNLTYSNIYSLGSHFFIGTPNLQILDLSYNRLSSIDFNISTMPSLTSLLLSGNNIWSLGESAMSHIDTILESNRSFILDLRFNPIACDCDHLHFLEWLLLREKILYGNMSTYSCVLSSYGSKSMPDGYGEVVGMLRGQCRDNHVLFLAAICVTMIVVVGLLLSIAYRFRWSLRYWFYTVKLMASSRREAHDDTFDYDAFICYSHADEDFVVDTMLPELSTQRGVNLMIHGQSFKAGRLIIDNILIAVRRCRKTVVVLTKSMLESKWCLYELQMARMESINTGRSVLIFVFLENIAYKDIKHDIVSYIRTNSVTAYPPGQHQRKVFWDKLAHDIKDVS